SWQLEVIRAITKIEQAEVDEQNRDLEQAYQSQLSTYHNRLGELRAMAVNDLLQGQSEAANLQVLLSEFKRQGLAVISKEFDAQAADDVLTDLEAMGSRRVEMAFRRFDVTEVPDPQSPEHVNVDYGEASKEVNLPAPDLPVARAKGRYIQFLEQA